MDKRFLIFFISITFFCDSNQNRIGYGTFNLGEDKNGTNWMYISSNYTLIFDKVYTSTSGFNLYFPFVLIEAYHIPNLTLILKNENNIVVNNIGDLFGVHAFNFRGNKETKFIIQGDGKLTNNFQIILQTVKFIVIYYKYYLKYNLSYSFLINILLKVIYET